MSLQIRERVITLHNSGFRLKDIQALLKLERINISKTSLCLLIKKYKRFGIITDKLRSAQPQKLTLEHLQVIDEALERDDEISTPELRAKLRQEIGVNVSISTIQHAKRALGKHSNIGIRYAYQLKDHIEHLFVVCVI